MAKPNWILPTRDGDPFARPVEVWNRLVHAAKDVLHGDWGESPPGGYTGRLFYCCLGGRIYREPKEILHAVFISVVRLNVPLNARYLLQIRHIDIHFALDCNCSGLALALEDGRHDTLLALLDHHEQQVGRFLQGRLDQEAMNSAISTQSILIEHLGSSSRGAYDVAPLLFGGVWRFGAALYEGGIEVDMRLMGIKATYEAAGVALSQGPRRLFDYLAAADGSILDGDGDTRGGITSVLSLAKLLIRLDKILFVKLLSAAMTNSLRHMPSRHARLRFAALKRRVLSRTLSYAIRERGPDHRKSILRHHTAFVLLLSELGSPEDAAHCLLSFPAGAIPNYSSSPLWLQTRRLRDAEWLQPLIDMDTSFLRPVVNHFLDIIDRLAGQIDRTIREGQPAVQSLFRMIEKLIDLCLSPPTAIQDKYFVTSVNQISRAISAALPLALERGDEVLSFIMGRAEYIATCSEGDGQDGVTMVSVIGDWSASLLTCVGGIETSGEATRLIFSAHGPLLKQMFHPRYEDYRGQAAQMFDELLVICLKKALDLSHTTSQVLLLNTADLLLSLSAHRGLRVMEQLFRQRYCRLEQFLHLAVPYLPKSLTQTAAQHFNKETARIRSFMVDAGQSDEYARRIGGSDLAPPRRSDRQKTKAFEGDAVKFQAAAWTRVENIWSQD